MAQNEDTVTKTDDLAPSLPPKNTWYWMKNSNGEASASLTFAATSFVVITVWILASIFETIVLGSNTLTTREPPTEGVILAYLGTTFSLYFGRRYVGKGGSNGGSES